MQPVHHHNFLLAAVQLGHADSTSRRLTHLGQPVAEEVDADIDGGLRDDWVLQKPDFVAVPVVPGKPNQRFCRRHHHAEPDKNIG